MATTYTRYHQQPHVMPQDSRPVVAALAIMLLIIAVAGAAYFVDSMYKGQQDRAYPGIETMVDAAKPTPLQGSLHSPVFINTPLKRQAKL